MTDIAVAVQVIGHFGDIDIMREAWMEADRLGVDRIYTSDHLNAIPVDVDLVTQPNKGETNTYRPENVFEGGSIEAAMAVTTSNARTRPHLDDRDLPIECGVHRAGGRVTAGSWSQPFGRVSLVWRVLCR